MMSRFAALLILLVPCTGYAQSFSEQLRQAAVDDRSGVVAELVSAHRLEVKDVVHELVGDLTRASRDGDDAAAASARAAVARIAGAFEAVFGERSLSIIAAQTGRWDRGQLVEKLAADSLFAAAVAIRRSEPDSAQTMFNTALAHYRVLGDAAGEAEVLGQLGYVSWYIDRTQYIPRNLDALEARRAVDDRQLIGNTLNDLGLGNRILTRDYESAVRYYREGETLRREIGDSLALSRMLPNIGLSYEGLGDYSRARDYYLEGAAIYLAVGDTAQWITQRTNAASILTDYAGRHSEALAIMLDLEQDLELTDNARTRAIVLTSIGVVNRRLGDYAGAVENYREVIRISEEHGFDDLLARALNNIGVVYIFMARPDRAVSFLERALTTMPEDDADGRTDVLLSLSSASFQLGEYPAAEIYIATAREIATDRTREAKLLKMSADTKVRSGHPAEAIKEYEVLLSIADELEIPDLETDALFGMGEAAEIQGEPAQALAYYDRAAVRLETARGLLRAEEDKAGYLAQTRYLYEDIVHFLTKEAIVDPAAGFGEKAFEFAERGKSRAFLDQMTEALARVQEGVDPELRSDLDQLSQNMAYLRGELASADPAADRERIAELKGAVAEMEGEYDRVEREMRERNPRYAAIQYPDPIEVSELQTSVLQDGEVLLQYALGDSSSTLWVVTPTSLELYPLPVRSEIEDQIELLRFALENPEPTVDGFARTSRRMYDMLVGPASDRVSASREVIIVPDGALNYVPFEALLTADGGGDFGALAYLLRTAPVSYVQSASVLRQLRGEPRVNPTRELLAVGDPAFSAVEGGVGVLRGASLARLPFSGAEVTSIASMFGSGKSEVLLGDDATIENVRAALKGGTYRFVHFATHGLVNDDRPDFSALALAGSGPESLLQASEIFNLSIKADLVVLSACETGLGQLIKGEGVVGLTRAFMYAGAPSVAVSLWSVSDRSTSELMKGLYGALVTANSDKSSALQTAKLRLLDDPETAHPFHWAPFVLVGRSN